MSNPKVYLCGPISGLTPEEATITRRRIDLLLDHKGIEAYSPMRKANKLPDGQVIGSGAYDHVTPALSAASIFKSDFNDVKTADCILADLRGSKKVSLGSMVELGWADVLRIPVVVLMEPENIHNHIFVQQIATFITDQEMEAIDFVSMLVKGTEI